MESKVSVESYIHRFNRLKDKIGKKNISLIRDKKILENEFLSDNDIQNIILSLSFSLKVSKANIFRYLSFKIFFLSQQNNKKKSIFNEIFNSGVILIFLVQVTIPLCIIISEFEYLFTPNTIDTFTYKFSSFTLSMIFMYHIHNELTNEYRESYLLLHTNNNNKELILIGMMSNFICSLLSIICIPIVFNSSVNIIELVFNSTAILFLCELDESMLRETYKHEYEKFISKYKIDNFHSHNFEKKCLYNTLYNINYYIFWFTEYFCRVFFFGLPLLLLFFY